MPTPITRIVDAVRGKNYATATEAVAQVLQQKVEQRLVSERQTIAATLVRESVLNEMPSLGIVGDDEEAFYVNSIAFGGTERAMYFARLRNAGIPKEAMRGCHSPYENLIGIAVKRKYAKKADKALFNEAVTEKKEKLLCHNCGHVFMASLPAKCPECGCRTCIVTDDPLSEAAGRFKVKCNECGKVFKTASMIPECPKCGGSDMELAEGMFSPDFKCNECGKVFRSYSLEPQCPDCGGLDIELDMKGKKGLREAKDPVNYYAGSDKEGWVLFHQGQPLNANPQGGIPVSRERVKRVAKQFHLNDDIPVWNGKDYTYAFGESVLHESMLRCTECGKQWAWLDDDDEPECPKCGNDDEDSIDVVKGSKKSFKEAAEPDYKETHFHDDDDVPGHKCAQCKKDMGNEWILGPVCGKCCRKNHKKATGR